MKNKILFIPPYIAPLKYYAELFPRLKEKYDVGFLFIGPDSDRRREMVAYSEQKKYEFHSIEKGLRGTKGVYVPFFTPLKERYEHSKACRDFLIEVRPSKIIAHKAGYAFDTIFKEANRLGIETIILQWSSEMSFVERTQARKKGLRRLYFYIVERISGFLDLFYEEPKYGFTPGIPKKIGVFSEDKIDFYTQKGYDPKTVHVVGSPDFQAVRELKDRVDSEPSFKKHLLQKYHLNPEKMNIAVILYRFYLSPPQTYKMTVKEHVAHHYRMFELLRSVFPIDKADITLRMHPTENNTPEMYESYKKLGVQLCYGAEARTDELLCLSDLCVSEPSTTVNNMIRASGVPALFVNFSEFKDLDNAALYFRIHRVINKESDFVDALREWERGSLSAQYEGVSNVNSIDAIMKLID